MSSSKVKYQLEFVIKSSRKILYNFLSNPSGLEEWFADEVYNREGVFSFLWDGHEQKAKLLKNTTDKLVRFRWLDQPRDTFFEFKLEQHEITKDVYLTLTDFCDEDEVEDSKSLWEKQIDDLKQLVGS